MPAPDKHMKVVHILLGKPRPDTASGVSRFVYHLAKHQRLQGADVSVMSLTRKCRYNGQVLYDAPDTRMFHQPSNRFLVSRAFLRAMCEKKPDILHLHSAFVPEFQYIAWRLRHMGISYAFSPHGAYRTFAMAGSIRKFLWLRAVEAGLLQKAKAIHFLTCSEANEFERHHIKTRAKRIIAPNGVDEQPFRDPILAKQFLLKRLALPQGAFVVLFLGRRDIRVKGLDLLLAAFSRLGREHADRSHLVLVGPDVNGSSATLLSMARRFGIRDQFHLVDPIYGDEKLSLMAGADVFCLTSRSEGCPGALLEALSVGARCVVSTEVGIADDIAASLAGWVCRPNSESIAASLTAALGQVQERHRVRNISRNSVHLAMAKYTWPHVSAAILAGYKTGSDDA